MKLTETASVRRNGLIVPTAVLAGLVLALTACGGGGETAPGNSKNPEQSPTSQAPANIYQFDQARVSTSGNQEPFVARNGRATVALSGELAGALPEGSAMAVDHFTLRAKAFRTGICRLDADITYKDGGRKALMAGRQDHEDNSPQSALMSALTGHSVDTEEEIVDEPPGDDETTKGSRYVTRDLSHITVVKECSEEDDDHLVKLAFPYAHAPQGEGIHSSADFAYVKIAVSENQDGGSASIIITGGTDAEVSASGEWAPPKT
ncbi:hypothetical protein [Streptomyces sp. NRRL F-5053]|uniref:hypothetical protein n=1 Tax=Streptomyces sp. NRRL F-5053 TaxID=1463854 RepID=UPI0013313755|nr:hypothetical protein [Streptomyces sp. NRRL F-5053]